MTHIHAITSREEYHGDKPATHVLRQNEIHHSKRVKTRRYPSLHLGIPWARPGQIKPDLKFLGPSPTRPDLQVINQVWTWPKQTKAWPKLGLNYVSCRPEPGPAWHSGSKIRPKPDPTCKPDPAWLGIFGTGWPGYPCPAVPVLLNVAG
jgi:hypothetical protein